MDTWTFWLPILLLFLSAFLAAILRLRAKDICLKQFNRHFCLMKTANNRWLWGDLRVFPDALELRYRQKVAYTETHDKASYLLYSNDIGQLQFIARPSPKEGTPEYESWRKELEAINNPSFVRVVGRRIRNLFNLLRDAFSQTLSAVIGVLTRQQRIQKVSGGAAEKRFNEMGQSVLGTVPNAYEHVLEYYLGKFVVCESMRDGKLLEENGILQDYSGKYLLIRGVELVDAFPAGAFGCEVSRLKVDLILPRSSSLVRHLSEVRNSGGAADPRKEG